MVIKFLACSPIVAYPERSAFNRTRDHRFTISHWWRSPLYNGQLSVRTAFLPATSFFSTVLLRRRRRALAVVSPIDLIAVLHENRLWLAFVALKNWTIHMYADVFRCCRVRAIWIEFATPWSPRSPVSALSRDQPDIGRQACTAPFSFTSFLFSHFHSALEPPVCVRVQRFWTREG